MLRIHSVFKRIHPLHRLLRSPYCSVVRRGVAYNAKAFVPNENGPNIHIIRWLTREMENEGRSDAEDNPYKARAFQRACKVIDSLPEAITSGDEAIKLVGIGEGIARRIDEYLTQGPERASFKPSAPLQKTSEEAERDKCLAEFRRVPGIGPVKAQKLYDAGCRSLEDLQKPEYSKSLSSPVRTALDYVDHLGERVTRAEIESVLQAIRPFLTSETKMYAVGSYRRGLPTCGDIDIIFFHPSCVYVPRPGEKATNGSASSSSTSTWRGRSANGSKSSREKQDTLLRELVLAPLERAGIIAATLSEGPTKWQGIVRIPNGNGNSGLEPRGTSSIFRRMDLSLYPTLSEGAALLATTGDTDFVAHVRRSANKMGLLLNEFGLWKFCRRTPITSETYEKYGFTEEDGYWELVASTTENEILDELGVEYIEPERRNFAFVVSRSRQGKGSMLKSSREPVVPKVRRSKRK